VFTVQFTTDHRVARLTDNCCGSLHSVNATGDVGFLKQERQFRVADLLRLGATGVLCPG